MKKIDFNNKRFFLEENSENGTANKDTVFEYNQVGNLVTAFYYGGSIKAGRIIAIMHGEEYLEMLYHCCTTDNELRAGKAIAVISYTEANKLKLSLNWEWIGNELGTGTSVYIEN